MEHCKKFKSFLMQTKKPTTQSIQMSEEALSREGRRFYFIIIQKEYMCRLMYFYAQSCGKENQFYISHLATLRKK